LLGLLQSSLKLYGAAVSSLAVANDSTGDKPKIKFEEFLIQLNYSYSLELSDQFEKSSTLSKQTLESGQFNQKKLLTLQLEMSLCRSNKQLGKTADCLKYVIDSRTDEFVTKH